MSKIKTPINKDNKNLLLEWALGFGIEQPKLLQVKELDGKNEGLLQGIFQLHGTHRGMGYVLDGKLHVYANVQGPALLFEDEKDPGGNLWILEMPMDAASLTLTMGMNMDWLWQGQMPVTLGRGKLAGGHMKGKLTGELILQMAWRQTGAGLHTRNEHIIPDFHMAEESMKQEGILQQQKILRAGSSAEGRPNNKNLKI